MNRYHWNESQKNCASLSCAWWLRKSRARKFINGLVTFTFLLSNFKHDTNTDIIWNYIRYWITSIRQCCTLKTELLIIQIQFWDFFVISEIKEENFQHAPCYMRHLKGKSMILLKIWLSKIIELFIKYKISCWNRRNQGEI